MFPVVAADWTFSLSSVQYSFAQRRAVCWALLLAILRVCRFLSLGVRLYSARAAHLASMTGVITADLASNQSCDTEDLFPKGSQSTVPRRVSHFSVAESPASRRSERTAPWNLVETSCWHRYESSPLSLSSGISLVASWSYSTPRSGLYLILQHTEEWSVSDLHTPRSGLYLILQHNKEWSVSDLTAQ